MYLLAIWLLNICESNGKYICQGVWSGDQPRESPFLWPKTIKPTVGEWHVWQWALEQSLSLNWWHLLSMPLGLWVTLSATAGWYFEKDSKLALALWTATFEQSDTESISNSVLSCSPNTRRSSPPRSNLHWVSVIQMGHKLIMSSLGPLGSA